MARDALPITWIRPLAEPYLRGYSPIAERRRVLRGYWFLSPVAGRRARRAPLPGRRSPTQLGFFVGYLVGAEGYAFLNPQPPECLIFVFVYPLGGSLHRRLVQQLDSLLRQTFTYIRWLTHRPPRFEFFEQEPMAMVRHCSMGEWPRQRYQHLSHNFFVETLAWLVRSGLVRRLLSGETVAGTKQKLL